MDIENREEKKLEELANTSVFNQLELDLTSSESINVEVTETTAPMTENLDNQADNQASDQLQEYDISLNSKFSSSLTPNLKYNHFSAYQLSGKENAEIYHSTIKERIDVTGNTETRRARCQYKSLSLTGYPGTTVMGAFESDRGGISSSIAVRLAFETFTSLATDYYDPYQNSYQNRKFTARFLQGTLANKLAGSIIKETNETLHRYGNYSGLGADCTATGAICVFDAEYFAVARIGNYEVYLIRDKKPIRFAEEESKSFFQPLGLRAYISAEVACFRAKFGDTIMITTMPHSEAGEKLITEIFSGKDTLDAKARTIATESSRLYMKDETHQGSIKNRQGLVMMLSVGAMAINLENMVVE